MLSVFTIRNVGHALNRRFLNENIGRGCKQIRTHTGHRAYLREIKTAKNAGEYGGYEEMKDRIMGY